MRKLTILAVVPVFTASSFFGPPAAAAEIGGDERIAYTSAGDIWTVRPDGTLARQITSGPATDSEPRWSPDGAMVSFVSGGGVSVIPAGGGIARSLAPTTEYSWSPDGSRILWTRTEDHALFVTEVATGAERHLVPGREVWSPAWSPDGRSIAFVAERATLPKDQDVFVVPAAGGAAVDLTASSFANDLEPVWSPDGSRLAFASTNIPGAPQSLQPPPAVNVIEADGTNPFAVATPSPLFGSCRLGYLSWSPDGSRLAYRETCGNPATAGASFFVVPVNGGTPIDLGGGPAPLAEGPRWSPTGQRLAYVTGPITRYPREVSIAYLLDDGSVVVSALNAMLGNGATTHSAVWSRDGRWLAFTADGLGPSNERTIGVTTIATIVTIAAGGDPDWRPYTPMSLGLVDPSTGEWHLRGAAAFFYGDPGDVPFLGDWDCDGIETPGLYRQRDGYVYLRNSNTQGIADVKYHFGNPGDVPLAGDFDGDGCASVSLYRPSEQRFYIIDRLGSRDQGLGAATSSFVFGDPGDVPFAGDLDGDGITEMALHRPSTGFVYYRDTLTTGPADRQFFYGDPSDLIVAGDWDEDGTDTVGLFRPSEHRFYLRATNTQGPADAAFWMGRTGWIPVVG